MEIDMRETWNGVEEAFKRAESKRSDRNKNIIISFPETGEKFTVKKKMAIPLLEALRTYQKMSENPENMSSDLSMTARMLQIFSEIH